MVRQGRQHDSDRRTYQQLLTDFPTEELLQPKPVPPAQRKPIPANANPDLVRKFEETADLLGINTGPGP